MYSRKLALSALVSIGLMGATTAQAQQSSWTGFYLGVNAGVGDMSANFNSVRVDPSFTPQYQTFLSEKLTSTLDDQGVIVGGQVGYNYQFGGMWVVGIEGDAQSARLKASRGTGIIPGPFPADPDHNANFNDSAEVENLYTLRGRLGATFDRLFVYGTAGWAWADVSLRRDYDLLAGTQLFRSGSDTFSNGWVLGAGFEYAIAKNWTIKGEYLRVNLDDAGSLTQLHPSIPGVFNSSSVDVGLNIIRAGLNYKF